MGCWRRTRGTAPAAPRSRPRQQPRQAHAVHRLPRRVLHQMAQQDPVQALPHLPVRIAQPIQRHAAQRLFPRDRQVAGLEQQRLRADVVHVERRQHIPRAYHLLQRHRGHPPLEQRLQQERRRPRLEPVRGELAAVEQQQHVVRVVHLLRPAPAIAVVPLPHLLPVQPAQLRREHRVQIPLRVPADRRVAPIERQVGEVVQLREQAHLRELADAGQERELARARRCP